MLPKPPFQSIIWKVIALIAMLPFAVNGAVTVQANAGLGQPAFTTSSREPIPDGSSVELGFFDIGFDLVANAHDPAALLSAWHVFGALETTTLLGEPGRLAGEISITDSAFDGRAVYWWVLQRKDSILLEYAIFTSASSNWRFPTEGSASTSRLLSSSEVDTVYHGSISESHLQTEPSVDVSQTSPPLKLDISRNLNSITLTFSSQPGELYQFYYSASLESVTWQALTVISAGEGVETIFLDTNDGRLSRQQGYYRVATLIDAP
ncbi:MAG: hypothetical protein ACI8T1_005258 [Verrucomicrobiales bacterium]|jgi:hypothetical protein